MPTKGPTLYSVYKTTIWFSISAILLLVFLIVMVVQDSAREWKGYQREFTEYSRELAEKELKAAEHAIDQEKLKSLKDKLVAAKETIKSKKSEIESIEAKLPPLDLKIIVANSAYQELKQVQDSERYFFEEHREHGEKEKAAKLEKVLAERGEKIKATKLEVEGLEKQREDIEASINAITGEEKKLTLEISRLTGEVTRIESKIAKLTPDWRDTVLNAPMMDFIEPSLEIQQIVLNDLYDDYYFAQVKKVDRCITCHLGIDQETYEDAPKPFASHPRLDLFVSQNSPHPMEEFGCTTCHGGGGHSATFTTAAHTPQNEEQGKEWKKKYHWKKMKHAPEKMLPLQYVEASCAKCHTDTFIVPEAKKLNEGRLLARSSGCFNCHKAEGFEDYWKVGPDLTRVQSKLQSDWMVRWLHNPTEFRPTTTMPQIFHLANTSDDDSKEKNATAIAGIAAYLMTNSEPVSLKSPSKKGNPEVGKTLVKDLGCMGCHGVEGKSVSDHGPMLEGMGSKVTADWLYTWLKNPKHYMPNTQMPDLRLSDEEASDITAYLLESRVDKFESIRLPLVKPETVDEMALHYLTGTKRHEEAKKELGKMSAEERLEFVGKKSIQHQGCYGCHDIKGFEDAKRIGAELTKEGSKDVHRFDFGFVHIPHTRHDWIYQKIKHPRSFDKGKDRGYYEKLRMPHYGFSDEEAEALTTFVLSLTGKEIPASKQRTLSVREREIELGRRLVNELNCQGCHTLDGVDGKARALFEDIGNAPPIIDGEGKKVQPDWLYHFLENPTPIRPWLKYRMPTFDLSEEELNIFVQYFNHLDQIEQKFISDKELEFHPKDLRIGEKLFNDFQCIKCHKSNPEPGLSASFLAPDLVMSKDRLRPEWVVDWLVDPQAIQEGTMMPGFFPDGQSPFEKIYGGDYMKQIQAIRDYMWKFTGEKTTSVKKIVTPATPEKKETEQA